MFDGRLRAPHGKLPVCRGVQISSIAKSRKLLAHCFPIHNDLRPRVHRCLLPFCCASTREQLSALSTAAHSRPLEVIDDQPLPLPWGFSRRMGMKIVLQRIGDIRQLEQTNMTETQRMARPLAEVDPD